MSQRRFSRTHILLVEDDDADVILVRRALEKTHFHNNLSVVGNGTEALQFLRRQGDYADAVRPGFILLDLHMPGMDGHETLQEIKSDDALKHIPVVILTTSDAQKDIADSYGHKAACHITKPSDAEQFTMIVQQLERFWVEVAETPSDE